MTVFGYAEPAGHVPGASASRMMRLASGAYSSFHGPGLLTAAACRLPLSIACTEHFVRTKVRRREALGRVPMQAAMSALLIFLPESLLANGNAPFVHDNTGWYGQFIDNSGAKASQPFAGSVPAACSAQTPLILTDGTRPDDMPCDNEKPCAAYG